MYLNNIDWWNGTDTAAVVTQDLRRRAQQLIPISFADLLEPQFSSIWSPKAHCPFPLLPGKEWGLVSESNPPYISGKQICDPKSGCCLMCGAANLIVQRSHIAPSLFSSPIPAVVRVLHTSYFFASLSVFGVAFLILSILFLPNHFTRQNKFVTAYACAGIVIATVQLINVQEYPKNVCYDIVTKGASENLKSCSINSAILEFCYIFTIGLSFQMSVLLHMQIVWGWRMRSWVSSVCFIFNTILASTLVGIIVWQGVQFYSGTLCQPQWHIAIGVGHAPLIPLSFTALVLQASTIIYAAKVLLKYRRQGHRRTSKGSQKQLNTVSALSESAKYQWRPLLITIYVTIVDNLNCSLVTSGDAHRATPKSLHAWVTCFMETGNADACRRDSHVKLAPIPWWTTYIPMFLMLLNGAMATAISFRISMLRGWYLIFRHPLSFWKHDEWKGNRPPSSVFSVASRRTSARSSRRFSGKIFGRGNTEEVSGSTQVGSQTQDSTKKHQKSLSLASTALSSNATTINPMSERHLSLSTHVSGNATPANVCTPQAAIIEENAVFDDIQEEAIIVRRPPWVVETPERRNTFGRNLDGFYHCEDDLDTISPADTCTPVDDIEASANDVKIKQVRVQVRTIGSRDVLHPLSPMPPLKIPERTTSRGATES